MLHSEPEAIAGSESTVRSAGSRGFRAALFSVFVNAVLALLKLIAGLLGHSQALIADAIESLADIAGSTVVAGGLAVSARPPDDNHPYGHGRAESLATLAVAFLLFGAAIVIAVEAVRGIFTPGPTPAAYTLVVLLVVVVIKEGTARYLAREGRKTSSTAIHVDAWHHRCDAVTSLAAAVGIAIALLGGEAYAVADDWAALVACCVLLMTGGRFARIAVGELMDTCPAQETLDEIRSIARLVPGVLDVEKVHARRMGSRLWVDIHLEVAPHVTVEAGHETGHHAKDALLQSSLQIADVMIHVEPHGMAWRRQTDR